MLAALIATAWAGRHAVVVGIDEYGASPGVPADQQWGRLRGAVNDAEAMDATLKAHGFDVELLVDAAATRDGIVGALDRLAARSAKGDVVLVHYSGHGQQVTDDDADEEDGYDESIVPYDNRGTLDPSKNVRDDAIEGALAKLVAATDHVVLVFDSCHSGQMSRGPAMTARGEGGDRPVQPPAAKRGKAADGTGLVLGRTGFVSMSAASSHQRAWEGTDASGEPVGLFTKALVGALDDMGPGATYETWFASARARMDGAPVAQDPRLEGDVTRELFGAGWGGTAGGYAVSVRDGALRVEAGSMHGLGSGTVLGLMAPGSDSTVAKARIASLHPAWSALEVVEGDAAGLKRTGGLAVELVSENALATPNVFVDAPKAVRDAIAASPFARVSTAAEAELFVQRVGDAYEIRRISGEVLGIPIGTEKSRAESVPAASPALASLLVQALESETKRRRIAGLANGLPGSQLPVRLEVQRIRATVAGGRIAKVDVLGAYSRSGVDEAKVDDQIRFVVYNEGSVGAWMAVVELATDGAVTVIWPGPYTGSENFVGPGETRVVEMPFVLTPPAGRQVWKLVGSEVEVDFRGLELRVRGETRGEARGAQTRLGALLAETVAPTRSAPLLAPPEMLWGVDQVTIDVR